MFIFRKWFNIFFFFLDAELSPEGRAIANQSAETLAEALLQTTNKNHDPVELVFPKICMLICDMQEIGEEIQKCKYNFLSDMTELGVPEEILELYCPK